MKTRPFEDQDLPVVSKWFEARGWEQGFLHRKSLPKRGWIAEDADGPLAVGWLYWPEETDLSFLEWCATRPNAGLRGLRGLSEVIRAAQDFAQEHGLRILQFIPNEKLVKFYEREAGFTFTEKASLMVWTGR